MNNVVKNAEFDVTSLNRGKVRYFWQGWNIHKFTMAGGAWASKKGSFYKGHYGYIEVIEPNSQGEWHIA